MFEFDGSPVPVRDGLKNAYAAIWGHLGASGPTMISDERIGLARHARATRRGEPLPSVDLPESVLALASTLFVHPGRVNEELVRCAADEAGDAAAVEAISIVSMLSAVDGTHRALGAELEPLPEPSPGRATGNIARGLKRRRTYLPMPPGAIPVAFDLLPDVGEVYRESYGPQYMTEAEMAFSGFRRSPGLNRAQIETIASRTSLLNECFY